MPRPRIDRTKSNVKRKGVRRKSKVVDHTLHRTYVVAQEIHGSDEHGYQETFVHLFSKDEEMIPLNKDEYGTNLRAINFISVPKGTGKNIEKFFPNIRDFKEYLKEIDVVIL